MEENIIKKIGDGIVNIAPSIGAILTASGVGAPVGAAVSALAALGRAFGLGDKATPTDLATAMLSDPEARLKVLAAENAFKLEMREKDITELKIILADVQNARAREVDTTKSTGKRDINMFILAWCIIGGFFGAIIALIALKIVAPANTVATDPILSMLFGSLSTNAGLVVGYFFGSSRGSDTKTDMIYNGGPSTPKKNMEN